MDTCVIFGALPPDKKTKQRLLKRISASDKIGLMIAADKGYETAKELGLAPDIIVGDFDSLGTAPEGDNVIQLPVRKDETDVGYAVRLGLERGYRLFEIYGAVGGLLDHTLANIAIALYIAENGGKAWFFGDEFDFTVIRNDTLLLPCRDSGRVSVFAVGGDAKGVSIRGLSYEAEDIEIRRSDHIGVSNEFTGKAAEISVKDGALLILTQNI